MARHAPARRMTATMAVATLLTACDGGEPPPAPDRGADIDAGDTYVAIGDSYTAAPETGPTERESGCLQSEENYPHLVADRLDLALTDVSCGGATTANLTQPQTTSNGSTREPQIEPLNDETDLVTMSLGGNDYGLYSAIVVNCVQAALGEPDGSPCTELDRRSGQSKAAANIDRIRERLVLAVQAVVEAAPNARVMLVGYPQFSPEAGPCEQLPLAEGDFGFARDVNEMLNAALERAAEESGAEYVDVYARTRGHHMCAEDPWIAGSSVQRDAAAPFHPYPEEQRVVADLITEALAS